MSPLALSEITIRPAYADDDSSLVRLATLDSAPVPAGPLLLAEVDGELRAALATDHGTVVADPFFPTVELIALLRANMPPSATRSRADAASGSGCGRRCVCSARARGSSSSPRITAERP